MPTLSWRRGALAAAGVALLAACTTHAPSPGPTEAPTPVRASVSDTGVTLTLTLASGRIVPGDTVAAQVDIRNDNATGVPFSGDLCTIYFQFDILGGGGQANPPGREWQGIARSVKAMALAQVVSMQGFGPVGVTDPSVPWTCAVAAADANLLPHQTQHLDALLHTTRSDGQPSAAGSYVAGFTFPRARPLRVELPFEIVGPSAASIDRALAVDAALADARLADWLARASHPEPREVFLTYATGQWTLTIYTLSGTPVVVVDATTGRVVSATIPGA